LAPNPWVSPDSLFIKPSFREPQMRGPKKSPSPQSPLSSGLGLGLKWVSPPNNTTLSQSQRLS